METIYWVVGLLGFYLIGIISGVALQQSLEIFDARACERFWKMKYKLQKDLTDVYGRWYLEEYEKNKERTENES